LQIAAISMCNTHAICDAEGTLNCNGIAVQCRPVDGVQYLRVNLP